MATEDADKTVEIIDATGFIVIGAVLAIIAFSRNLSIITFLVPAIAVGGGTSWLVRLHRKIPVPEDRNVTERKSSTTNA